jgi:branched-subunit amino acid ABC-type transport system permease component
MIGWLSDNLVSILNGVALGCLLFALAVGLSLVFGILDVLNLAHGSLFLAGAYAAWRLAGDGSAGGFLMAIILAAAIGGAGGLALTAATRPLAGRGHLDQALLTLGITLVVTELVQTWFGHDPHGVLPPLSGSVNLGGGYPSYRLALIGVGLIVALAVDWAVERTKVGALARATVCDPDMVAALGVNTRLVRTGAFAVGGALAAVAGVLGAPLLGANPHLDTQVLLLALVVIVIGGLGSVRGALLGALLIGQVQSLGVALAPRQAPFLLFGAMALVLVVRPAGLLGARTGAA